MGTNKKVLTIVFIMLTLLSASTIANVWFNFLTFGKKSAVEKAYSIAESVRDGLTAHMVLGAMDKKELFLHNMIQHQNVKMLRVIRAASTIKEFGLAGHEAYKYDDIEKSVLKTAKPVDKYIKIDGITYLRITIPYIASQYSNPNCLSCHVNAQDGSALGAISMEIDLNEVETTTYDTVVKIVLISIIFLILSFFITKHYIKPYVELFDDLETGISKAYSGDFSHYISTNLSNEAGNVAKRLNDLSEIFSFKKTIELDDKKENIYKRLAYILEHNFNLQHFILFENNVTTKKRKIVIKSQHLEFINTDNILKSKHQCRAFRTNTQVCSTNFHNICELCYNREKESMCLPFSISEDLTLTLLMYVDDEEAISELKENIPIIQNYFQLAKPVLQTKILMEKLHETSLKDPLTSLYNRRFLEHYIENSMNPDTPFSTLMVDIDFFKQVNDSYGHDVGDTVLKELAKVFNENIKGSDFSIRYGGEEFLILLFNVSIDTTFKIANQIREDFSNKMFKADKDTFSKTLSIGISYYEHHIHTPWQAIKYADVALYYAKEHGRNQVIEFQDSMYDQEII